MLERISLRNRVRVANSVEELRDGSCENFRVGNSPNIVSVNCASVSDIPLRIDRTISAEKFDAIKGSFRSRVDSAGVVLELRGEECSDLW